MKIIADENIPFVAEGFGQLGNVTLMPGRAIGPDDVRDADMLIVRSVTQVDAALLDGSSVKFVGTCTIGTDHIDVDYLATRGIAFAAAPGSNATSVAEYIVAVMLRFADRLDFRLAERTLGIIGVGNVGSRLERRARALGMNVLLNDPPLARETLKPKYIALDDVLAEADIVTLHVPLTDEGPDPTCHLVDEEFIDKMKGGAILMNSSRGDVHQTAAVLEGRRSGKLGGLYLDVWENEPAIDVDLLRWSDICSPHICGYSADGKVAGVVMIHRAACEFLGVSSDWDPSAELPAPALPETQLAGCEGLTDDALRGIVFATYDFARDDERLRETAALPDDARAKAFDALRKDYPCRREFAATRVRCEDCAPDVRDALAGLGFAVL
jgi:erythronate-4-phosphate dehydrogenase